MKKDKVILVCSQCLSRNYVTSKNKLQAGKRLELRKFCKNCNQHMLHKETR